MTPKIWFALLISCLTVAQAQGHEVWIEPQSWTVPAGDTIKASVKNGQDFNGFNLAWNDQSILRAELWADDTATEIEGRNGDRPALTVQPGSEGLVTLLYQTTHVSLVYNSFEEFVSFATEKGYDTVTARHAERGLSEAGVKEAFARYAKALVAVGAAGGSDRPRGMELELVALDNPYETSAAEMMTVQLLYKDQPRAGTQVTVFRRAEDASVDTLVMQSDDQGQVQFPLDAGTTYLVDAVVLREPSSDLVVSSRGAVWESLWASLTFQVPAAQ